MELISTTKRSGVNTITGSFNIPSKAYEVAVIEDNKLINLILSNELDSTISKITNSKDYPIKFSSFQFGTDFLNYLENKEFKNSRLIVFSDFYLEDEMNGGKILKRIKQKKIDATVIIMSDTTNKQTSVDTIRMGAHRFIPKDINTPIICSQILCQMVN